MRRCEEADAARCAAHRLRCGRRRTGAFGRECAKCGGTGAAASEHGMIGAFARGNTARERCGRAIANGLTIARMAGSAVLLATAPFSAAFYWIYTLSGLSDALDGAVARAAGSAGPLGARLDSAADLMLFGVMLFRLCPLLWNRLPVIVWCAAGIVLLLRLGAYITAIVKSRHAAPLHTRLNKAAGLAVFLLPYLVQSNRLTAYCGFVCALTGLAAIEEWLIHVNRIRTTPD